MRQDFVTAYRAVRMLASYSLTSPSETLTNETVMTAAIRGRFNRIEHRGGVECANTATDRLLCIRSNLDAARFRRVTGWADKQCITRFGTRAVRRG